MNPVTIYMPCVQARRTAGFAASLRRIGWHLMLSGPTNKWKWHFEQVYTAEAAKAKFGPNVGVYEGTDLDAALPTVMIVGREDNQTSMRVLWETIYRRKPAILLGYSGVVQSNFDYQGLHGVIATDLPSRLMARANERPSLRFRPYFDFDRHPPAPVNPTERVVLRSYINGLDQRFPMSARLLRDMASALQQHFGDRVLIENVSGLSLELAHMKMRESTATLHIKDEEGFGWSLVESLAFGRPIICQSGLSKNMAFLELGKIGESIFTFRDAEQLTLIVGKFLTEHAFVRQSQEFAASYIRREYRADDFAHELKKFIDALLYIENLRWSKNRFNKKLDPINVSKYVPSLDPEYQQDYEKLM